MPPPLTLFAAASFAVAFVGAASIMPRMRRLAKLSPSSTGEKANVAVVVAARNEEENLEDAISSLLASGARVVVVDDRSTDGTPRVLAELARAHPQLTVIRVDDLPGGWLGKNHALERGAEAAGDVEYLLFTDADVLFAPGGIAALVEHAARLDLDHLTGAPRVTAHSWALGGMVATFGLLFALFLRPWRIADPRSRAAAGIGAVNLVRRSAYERAGGHGAIRMRIDDDVRLGRLLKEAGGRSAFVFAGELAAVEWYPTLPHMLRGLHKNVFAGIDFRVGVAVAATAVLLAVFLAPFGLAVAPGVPPAARALFAAAALVHLAGAADAAQSANLPRRCGLFLPAGITLFLWVLWKSTIGALVTGQVVWRGTAYSLAELKASR